MSRQRTAAERAKVLLTLAAVIALAAETAPAASQAARRETTPRVIGIDHIPIAVSDLPAASEQYRQLGFSLKPGRPHANGIQNQHVKFADGTEIELITAAGPRDPLTASYMRHLEDGDGPAFVGFYTSGMDALARRFDAEGRPYRRAGGLLSLSDSNSLRYVFFGNRNASPTDRPEHFRHANGAEALIGVWLADDDLSAEHDLLAGLGAQMVREAVHAPDPVIVTLAKLPHGEVVFLTGSRQLVKGRRIVGATVRVRDLEAMHRLLTATRHGAPPVVDTKYGASIFLPPSVTHGIWLEFRADRTDDSDSTTPRGGR